MTLKQTSLHIYFLMHIFLFILNKQYVREYKVYIQLW